MTGLYLRVQRNGKWESVELEHLTNDERAQLFTDNSKTLMFLNALCWWLTENINEAQP